MINISLSCNYRNSLSLFFLSISHIYWVIPSFSISKAPLASLFSQTCFFYLCLSLVSNPLISYLFLSPSILLPWLSPLLFFFFSSLICLLSISPWLSSLSYLMSSLISPHLSLLDYRLYLISSAPSFHSRLTSCSRRSRMASGLLQAGSCCFRRWASFGTRTSACTRSLSQGATGTRTRKPRPRCKGNARSYLSVWLRPCLAITIS